MSRPRDTADGVSYEALREAVATRFPVEGVRLVERAYRLAERMHEGQLRRSGDPYITHPLAVADIVTSAGGSVDAVCAALLHDVIDDTAYPLPRLRREFGSRVAVIIEGLLRRDALATAAADREVVLLALADRLHNIRTARFLARSRRQRVARETLEHFVPLANRNALPLLGDQLASHATSILGWAELRRRASSTGSRLLALAAMLLPARVRLRWFEEWLGELSVLTGRRARVQFCAQTLRGVPALAVMLHRSHRSHQSRSVRETAAGGTGVTGVLLSALAAGAEMPAWLSIAIPLLCTAVIVTVLLAPSDAATQRLIRIIRAWRRS